MFSGTRTWRAGLDTIIDGCHTVTPGLWEDAYDVRNALVPGDEYDEIQTPCGFPDFAAMQGGNKTREQNTIRIKTIERDFMSVLRTSIINFQYLNAPIRDNPGNGILSTVGGQA